MELERQGPPLRPLGSDPGSALLYGRKESLVSGCYVQGRTVQLQALRNRQAGRLNGWLTGGYQLRLNKALALDFSLGLGYLNADYEKYEVIDGVRVRKGSEAKDWWGPINAGVTLVWKLF